MSASATARIASEMVFLWPLGMCLRFIRSYKAYLLIRHNLLYS